MFANFSFGRPTVLRNMQPVQMRRWEKIALLQEELADDPMIIDTDDFPETSRPETEPQRSEPHHKAAVHKIGQKRQLESLAEETLLLLIKCLLDDGDIGMKAIESLSLTSRHMHTLTTDPTFLGQYVEQNSLWDCTIFYPNVTWTIATLKRLRKSATQTKDLALIMVKLAIAHGPRDMTHIWSSINFHAITIIQAMGGLSDNMPGYSLLDRIPFPCLVALHVSSLLFGKRFMTINKPTLEWLRLSSTGRYERSAALNTFLVGGPVDAMRLLQWNKGLDSEFKTIVRKFKATIISCAETPDANEYRLRPDLYLQEIIERDRKEWLWQTNDGADEEAWVNTPFGQEERKCIVGCVKSWWRGVPPWLG